MPLEERADDHLMQRCSGCGTADIFASAALVADDTASADPRVFALPICTSCGAQEFLVRSGESVIEGVVPGSYSHLRRLLVDHLHERLAAGSATALGAKRKTSKAPTDASGDALQRWFPDGLKLAPPDGAERATPPKQA
jgi:hypothetical protein